MERHTRKHTRAQKGEGGASRLITAIVVMASIVLIGVMIWLSPLGPMLKEHVIDPIAAFVRGETRDSDIVSALKTQDEQQETPSPSPSATPNPVKKTVETVHATPYYILQMGTFLETASAKEHAQKIMELGAAGVVYEDGAVYRVFAAAYTDEESLIKVQSQVRADGFEATPYITEQNTVKITLEGVEQAIRDAQAAIGYLSTVPDELCKLSLSYDKGQVTAQETVQKLVAVKEQSDAILNVFQTQTDGNMLKPVLSVIQKYADHISTFLQEHDTMINASFASELKRLQIETIIDYIRFFDQK